MSEKFEEQLKKESVLDQPKKDLDPIVWDKVEDENGNTVSYSLTETAKSKIYVVIEWGVRKLGVSNYGVNIIGSIASNQYTDGSDIDVHFNSEEISPDRQEKVNKLLKESFEDFKAQNEDVVKIGEHPIEVYFQSNPFQDMMSVGCYDVINERWLVGPGFQREDFDPYAEYYDEDMTYVQDIIDDIRNVILEAFESTVAIQNSKDKKFRKFEMGHLRDKVGRAAQIFTRAREFRKVSSTPRNEIQAKANRASRKWKIADSAFKLMDKFGYLGILRTMTWCYEKMLVDEISDEEIVTEISKSVRENLVQNGSLDENERMSFEEVAVVGEGKISDIAKYAMLIGSLAMPFSSLFAAKDGVGAGVVDGNSGVAASVGEIAKRVPQSEMKTLVQQFGGMSYSNNVNMLAWTIWSEANGEYRKYGLKSLTAIASVLKNRAGGDRSKYVQVVSKKYAFSWWNDYRGGWDDKTYVPQSPSVEKLKNTMNKKVWEICNDLAVRMMEGKFVSTIGNYNSYLNKKTASKKAVDTWGKKCKYRIGNHSFGYLPENDGYRKNKKISK